MSTPLKKVFKDIRLNPGRFSLVVFALVIGIWGVGSILVSYYILSRDLGANFLNTRPAHAVFTSRDLERLDLGALRAKPEIEAAEFRDFSIHRIEVSPDRWIPLWLYGVGDFNDMRLARVELEAGEVAAGKILVERDGLRVSNFATVKQPRARLPKGMAPIPISGIAFDPAQAPATQDAFIYAYTDQATYAELTGEPSNHRLILRLKDGSDKARTKGVVDQLVKELSAQGIRIHKVEVPEPNEHPHQWQLDTLMLLQGSISLLAFAMAAVLISQLMASILSRQVRQIGVLKAIGASRAQVMRMYSTMVVALGILAALAGVPLAVASGYGFSYFVAYQLNFDILTTELPLHLYLAIVAVSMLLPLALSLPLLLRGTRISVRDALSDYGITAEVQTAKTVTTRLRFLPKGLVLAVRNTLRQKRRLAVTLLTMALGVAIFSTGFNVRQSLALLLQETEDSMRYDVRVVFEEPITAAQADDLFRPLANVTVIEAWNGGRGEMQTRLLSDDSGIGVAALPKGSELLRPKLERGRWLRHGTVPEMVMNMQAWQASGSPAVGSKQTVMLADKQVEMVLVGLVEEFERAKIYMEQEAYDRTLGDPEKRRNSFMFAARDQSYGAVLLLKRDIERLLADTDLRVLEVMSHAERMRIIYDHLNIILSVILFLAFTVLSVSALGMASAMGITILERTREIGVLRAIGATPAKVFRMFETEGLLLSVASIVLGLALSWPLSSAAASFFGDLMLGGADLKFAVSPQGVWVTLVTTLVFGWLASRLPARNAVKLSTRQALAYE